MRIAILSTSYPTHPQDPSGHFVRSEALNLAQQGHEVHVLAPQGPKGQLCQDPSIELWSLIHGGAFGWPGAPTRLRENPFRLTGAAAFMALASDRLRRLKPDKIVAHWIVPCAHPIVSTLPFKGELEVVAHGADVRMLLALPSAFRTYVMTQVISMSQRIRFAAHAIYHDLAAGLPPSLQEQLKQHVQVCPPTIVLPDVSKAAATIRKSLDGKPLAVTVGRLIPSKRVDLAIEATGRMTPPTKLAIIGDGPDRDRLLRLQNNDHVHFQGMLPRNTALAWIAAADVLVHTSMSEAAPTVIREARSLGTPVVACNAGDVALWARHDEGIICVQLDAQAVASAMTQVVQRTSIRL